MTPKLKWHWATLLHFALSISFPPSYYWSGNVITWHHEDTEWPWVWVPEGSETERNWLLFCSSHSQPNLHPPNQQPYDHRQLIQPLNLFSHFKIGVLHTMLLWRIFSLLFLRRKYCWIRLEIIDLQFPSMGICPFSNIYRLYFKFICWNVKGRGSAGQKERDQQGRLDGRDPTCLQENSNVCWVCFIMRSGPKYTMFIPVSKRNEFLDKQWVLRNICF